MVVETGIVFIDERGSTANGFKLSPRRLPRRIEVRHSLNRERQLGSLSRPNTCNYRGPRKEFQDPQRADNRPRAKLHPSPDSVVTKPI